MDDGRSRQFIDICLQASMIIESRQACLMEFCAGDERVPRFEIPQSDSLAPVKPAAPILGFLGNAVGWGSAGYRVPIFVFLVGIVLGVLSMTLFLGERPATIVLPPPPIEAKSAEVKYVARVVGMSEAPSRWSHRLNRPTRSVPDSTSSSTTVFWKSNSTPAPRYCSKVRRLLKSHRPTAARCAYGRLTAQASSLVTRPFAVQTGQASVQNAGAEFGVWAEERGFTEVHCFRGTTNAQPVDSLGSLGETRRLAEGQAVRFSQRNRSATVSTLAADERIFRRSIAPSSPAADPAADYSPFVKHVVALKPLVYYRMEPNMQNLALDYGSSRSHGTLFREFDTNNPWVPGRVGEALQFRGKFVCDHVLVPNYPKPKSGEITVMAWVLATGRPSWAMIAANWGTDKHGQFHLGLCREDGDLRVEITEKDGYNNEFREGPQQPFPVGSWQFVAFTADKKNLRLYRNGDLVGVKPCFGIIDNPAVAEMGIGCKPNNDGTGLNPQIPGFWQGLLDEIAVFDRALSARRYSAIVRRICGAANRETDCDEEEAFVAGGEGSPRCVHGGREERAFLQLIGKAYPASSAAFGGAAIAVAICGRRCAPVCSCTFWFAAVPPNGDVSTFFTQGYIYDREETVVLGGHCGHAQRGVDYDGHAEYRRYAADRPRPRARAGDIDPIGPRRIGAVARLSPPQVGGGFGKFWRRGAAFHSSPPDEAL